MLWLWPYKACQALYSLTWTEALVNSCVYSKTVNVDCIVVNHVPFVPGLKKERQ